VRPDVIVAGAGPAGAVCATLLARTGMRVSLFDRATFPRHKLCGDTLNPGALRTLARVMPVQPIVRRALPLDGMLLSGPGVIVRAAYGRGAQGHAILRRDLDLMLLDEAQHAGVQFNDRITVLGPIRDGDGTVTGIQTKGVDGRPVDHRAGFVVAADGRSSRLAKSIGLSLSPPRPRRWAIGGYFQHAIVDARFGEMHVRRGHYVGVAPVPGALANVCVVVPHTAGDGGWRHPDVLLNDVVRRDPMLAERFSGAELVDGPHVLGPMAVDTRGAGVPGMLLAGDAAGFIDPITGDGLRFAIESGRLTADVVAGVLDGRIARDQAAHVLAARRRAAFARKWTFNRAVRLLVEYPAAVSGAAIAARVAPWAFRAVIRYAGDV
jgi:flavin-dependent dehydrogenase